MSGAPDWRKEVLQFWFGELQEGDWFGGEPALDESIRARFGALHAQLTANAAADRRDPNALLAAVIVLDQFSRHLYRGDPRAYAADPLARQLANEAIEQGFDFRMTPPQRLFLYLPFEHSESAEDQARCLALMQTLGNERWTQYSLAHKSLIDRFGRFPHRNAVLGRKSTAEEIEALRRPGNLF